MSVITVDGSPLPVPGEVLAAAGIAPGDTVVVRVEDGRVVVHKIDPDQAWYWTPEFQAGEREIEADERAGRRGPIYWSEEEFEAALRAVPPAPDRE